MRCRPNEDDPALSNRTRESKGEGSRSPSRPRTASWSRAAHRLTQVFDPAARPEDEPTTLDTRADTGARCFMIRVSASRELCHPEGREDGRTGNRDIGKRASRPWRAACPRRRHFMGWRLCFAELIHEVFESRLGGARRNPSRSQRQRRLDRIPPARPGSGRPAGTVAAIFERRKRLLDLPHRQQLTKTVLTTSDPGTSRGISPRYRARAPFRQNGCARRSAAIRRRLRWRRSARKTSRRRRSDRRYGRLSRVL